MDGIPDWEICSSLANRFWGCMDRRDYGGLLGLLAEDARWERQGQWFEGHEAIRGSLEARPPNLLVRHLVSNVTTSVGTSGIDCHYYLTVLSNPDAGDQIPAPIDGIGLMGEVECVVRKSDEVTRILELSARPIFLNAKRH